MKTHDNTVAAYSRKLALSLLQSSIIFFIIFALTMPNFALAQDSADSSELKSRQGWEFELGLSYLHTYKPEHNSDDQEWRMLECDGLLANLSFGYRFNPYVGFYFENDIGGYFCEGSRRWSWKYWWHKIHLRNTLTVKGYYLFQASICGRLLGLV
ncbi:MAG: hypothetical protein WC966_05305 [Bradymonadales bacterium]